MRALVPVSIRTEARARHARQPAHRDARAAAGLHPRPGGAPSLRAPGHGRPQGVEAGGRRGHAGRGQQPRAAHDPGAGLAAELLDPPVQPDRDEHPGPAVPALRAGPPSSRTSFPLAFLPENHALAMAIMSYDGGLDFGLLGDYDALPDIEVIADGIDASLRELLDAVPRERAGRSARRRRGPERRAGADPAHRGRAAQDAARRPTCGPSGRAVGLGAQAARATERPLLACRFACAGLPFREHGRPHRPQRDRLPARAHRRAAQDRAHRAEVAVGRPRARGARRQAGRSGGPGQAPRRARDPRDRSRPRAARQRRRPPESAAQNPSANLASSLIRSGVHGGENVIIGLDLLDAVQLAHELLDLLGHLRSDRAPRAGQRVGDAHRRRPSTSTS